MRPTDCNNANTKRKVLMKCILVLAIGCAVLIAVIAVTRSFAVANQTSVNHVIKPQISDSSHAESVWLFNDEETKESTIKPSTTATTFATHHSEDYPHTEVIQSNTLKTTAKSPKTSTAIPTSTSATVSPPAPTLDEKISPTAKLSPTNRHHIVQPPLRTRRQRVRDCYNHNLIISRNRCDCLSLDVNVNICGRNVQTKNYQFKCANFKMEKKRKLCLQCHLVHCKRATSPHSR